MKHSIMQELHNDCKVDSIAQILHAEEYHRPDYNEMLSTIYSLMSKYSVDKVYIDGTNPSFIKSLKLQIGEDPDYEHKAMLGHCKMILEQDPGYQPRQV